MQVKNRRDVIGLVKLRKIKLGSKYMPSDLAEQLKE